jgi:hypothetical protein
MLDTMHFCPMCDRWHDGPHRCPWLDGPPVPRWYVWAFRGAVLLAYVLYVGAIAGAIAWGMGWWAP